MRAIICGALMAVGVTAAGAAEVDRDSANYWLPHCKAAIEQRDSLAPGICIGAISGLAFVLRAIPAYCADVPYAATYDQIARVVIRYIEEHPQRMHKPFLNLAVEALHDAWPCR